MKAIELYGTKILSLVRKELSVTTKELDVTAVNTVT